jgi:hypothetical protein
MARSRSRNYQNFETNPDNYSWLELYLLCALYQGIPPECYTKKQIWKQIQLGMILNGIDDPELPPRNKSCFLQVAKLFLPMMGWKNNEIAGCLHILLLPKDHAQLEVIGQKKDEKHEASMMKKVKEVTKTVV